jgi:hypothetical protein
MNPITETEKAEWGKLCETATPEPWWNESGVLHAKNPGVWTEDNQSCIHPASCPETYWLNGNVAQQDKDADFIAAARTALPRLLAEVERLEKELAEAKACYVRGTAVIADFRGHLGRQIAKLAEERRLHAQTARVFKEAEARAEDAERKLAEIDVRCNQCVRAILVSGTPRAPQRANLPPVVMCDLCERMHPMGFPCEESKPATVTLQVSREWEIKAWALRDALRRRKYEQPAGRSSAETLAEYLLSEALAGVRKEGGA